MYNISEQDRQILIKAVEDKNLKVVFNLQEKYKDDKVIKVCYAKLIAASNKPEDIKRAINILQKIRSKGPSKMTLFELAKLNKTIGNFELAKDYLMEAYLLNDSFNEVLGYELTKLSILLKDYKMAKGYLQSLLKHNTCHFEYIFHLIYLYIHEKNYDKALELIKGIDKSKLITDELKDKYTYISLFLNFNMTLFDEEKEIIKPYSLYNNTYLKEQMEHYDSKKALNVILEHSKDGNKRFSMFNKDIDVNELFKKIPSMLNEDNFLYNKCYDVYIVKYPNVGVLNENLIEVITVANTKNVISMTPIFNYFNYIPTFNDELLKRDFNWTRIKK